MRIWFPGAAPLLLLAAPASAADSELYTFHCLWGCPIGAPATNDTIVREIYTLSSDDLTKMADWVAYRITSQTIATSQGQRNYRIDDWLDPSETLDESTTDTRRRWLLFPARRNGTTPISTRT
jgi:endonuclease G, mitochondrial